jgi:hypothetical protein
VKKIMGIIYLLLSGCATHKSTYLPDGTLGHSIGCDGSAMSWNLCYEKAGEICGAEGYTVVDQQGDSTRISNSNQYSAFSGAIVNRTLLIKCGKEEQPR